MQGSKPLLQSALQFRRYYCHFLFNSLKYTSEKTSLNKRRPCTAFDPDIWNLRQCLRIYLWSTL